MNHNYNPFNDFLHQKIFVLCANYFYTGVLTNVYDNCIVLEDAGIVYETGSWDDCQYKDVQKFNHKKQLVIKFFERREVCPKKIMH